MLDWDELDSAEEERSRGFPGADYDGVTDVRIPDGHIFRIFLSSDLHIDHKKNKEWMASCLASMARDSERPSFDCLLLPGDLCTGEDLFEDALRSLTDVFHVVCFCFGNHEAWTHGQKKGDTPAKDSFEKLDRIHAICKSLRVYTSPIRILGLKQPLLLLPLWSWYHATWDQEPDLPPDLQPPLDPQKRVSDFRLCKWDAFTQEPGFAFGAGGVTSEHLAKHFAARNEAWISAVLSLQDTEGGDILSYSHFCPRQELILEKRFSYDQHVPKISGSVFLEEQIRRVRPLCHAFGHTHVAWDTILDGIRYVHWPLGNPKEQMGQTKMQHYSGFLLLFDSVWSPVQFTHWAYFYDYMESRQPGSAKLAPWVSTGYAQVYPEMRPELEKRGLLSFEMGPDMFAQYFPGGASNNNSAFWVRHASANARWRLPPKSLVRQHFPCENAACLLCNFTLEQEAALERGACPQSDGLAA
mmetsp:Transcript_43276/g.101009  ORF Transcript_43276/g.101009 Transcript_43276/m.101009 type:complete len:469 (-) Transcript_43276:7-1413(-)